MNFVDLVDNFYRFYILPLPIGGEHFRYFVIPNVLIAIEVMYLCYIYRDQLKYKKASLTIVGIASLVAILAPPLNFFRNTLGHLILIPAWGIVSVGIIPLILFIIMKKRVFVAEIAFVVFGQVLFFSWFCASFQYEVTYGIIAVLYGASLVMKYVFIVHLFIEIVRENRRRRIQV